jgi:serine/threonine protein kinase
MANGMSSGEPTGRRIANRYDLFESLGKGGMGVVWRGLDTTLQRQVAIKEVKVPPSIPPAQSEAVRARASREARAAARLGHRGCVTIFDVIEAEDTVFIVMELVQAPTLAELVRREGRLDARIAAEIGLDLLEALEAAHRQGIIHRDVKPANVMVPERGPAKLADFGIASLKGDPKITTTGVIMGSPPFMSPEQAMGREAGPATDLWALGATLYLAVEGRPPFDKGQPIPTLSSVLHDEPRPPGSAGALEPVLRALLQKDPGDRADSAEVRTMLSSIIGRPEDPASAQAPSTPPPAREAEPESSARRAEPETSAAQRQKSKRTLIAAGALLAAALGAAGFMLLGGNDDPATEARSGPTKSEPREPQGGRRDEPRPSIDLATFEAPGTGFRVDRPAGWQEIPQESFRYDFRDPDTGSYLRVEWTDSPGASAVAAWKQQEQSFASGNAEYRRVRLEDVAYRNARTAALWEYTWSEDGIPLHAYNLGFVTADGSHGFALNLVSREANWDDLQNTWSAIKESFGRASG